MVRPQRTGPSATCLSSGAGGRGVRSLYQRPITCQCVSLAFRSGGQSQQLPAFCNRPRKKSVTPITDVRDCGQAGADEVAVLRLTALTVHFSGMIVEAPSSAAGVILTGASFQAKGRISRADQKCVQVAGGERYF